MKNTTAAATWSYLLVLVWMALGDWWFAGYTHAFVRVQPPSTSRNLDSSSVSFSRPLAMYSGKKSPGNSDFTQHRDLIIVGGGFAGLSVAFHTALLDPHRHITVYDANPSPRTKADQPDSSLPQASRAAAGMLAPHAERLPQGELLDLCQESRALYPAFVQRVEQLAQAYQSQQSSSSQSVVSVGYRARGGFLAPAFAGDAVATWAPPSSSSHDGGAAPVWLDSWQVLDLEPELNPSVVGGWWFPTDASVNPVALLDALHDACCYMGVDIQYNSQVTSLDMNSTHCHGITLAAPHHQYVACSQILVANGAWMKELLPVPIQPHKGQSLSLRIPPHLQSSPPLRRVLFAQDSYIVPQGNDRIVIGATVEAGSYNPDVTPHGLLHLLSYATQLVPALAHLPVEDSWVGLRPTTPDKGPILGSTPWTNVLVAGGYWRNGVLLTPKTGQLLAQLLVDPEQVSEHDRTYLQRFAWNRFWNSREWTVQARYSSSVHPVHTRTSSSSAVSELGTHSSARAAAAERRQERSFLNALEESEDGDDALERAALLGQQDGQWFRGFRPAVAEDDNEQVKIEEDASSSSASPTWPALLSDDTIHENDDTAATNATFDLSGVYESIRKNKQQQASDTDWADDTTEDDDISEDPGFRIYYVDPETKEHIEVPPYTAPGDFHASLDKAKHKDGSQLLTNQDSDNDKRLASRPSNSNESPSPVLVNGAGVVAFGTNITENESSAALEQATTSTSTIQKPADEPEVEQSVDTYNEQSFDGYVSIQEQNSRASRQDELDLMRKVRHKNRMGQSSIDESQLGGLSSHDDA